MKYQFISMSPSSVFHLHLTTPLPLWLNRMFWFPQLTGCSHRQGNRGTPAAVLSPLLSSSQPRMNRLPFKFPEEEGEGLTAWTELCFLTLFISHRLSSYGLSYSLVRVTFKKALSAGLVNWICKHNRLGPRHQAQRQDVREKGWGVGGKEGGKRDFNKVHI